MVGLWVVSWLLQLLAIGFWMQKKPITLSKSQVRCAGSVYKPDTHWITLTMTCSVVAWAQQVTQTVHRAGKRLFNFLCQIMIFALVWFHFWAFFRLVSVPKVVDHCLIISVRVWPLAFDICCHWLLPMTTRWLPHKLVTLYHWLPMITGF